VAIGITYVGYKAYKSAKAGKPLRESARELGATIVAPFKGAYETLRPAKTVAPVATRPSSAGTV